LTQQVMAFLQRRAAYSATLAILKRQTKKQSW
jgi:hypothetical protein